MKFSDVIKALCVCGCVFCGMCEDVRGMDFSGVLPQMKLEGVCNVASIDLGVLAMVDEPGLLKLCSKGDEQDGLWKLIQSTYDVYGIAAEYMRGIRLNLIARLLINDAYISNFGKSSILILNDMLCGINDGIDMRYFFKNLEIEGLPQDKQICFLDALKLHILRATLYIGDIKGGNVCLDWCNMNDIIKAKEIIIPDLQTCHDILVWAIDRSLQTVKNTHIPLK